MQFLFPFFGYALLTACLLPSVAATRLIETNALDIVQPGNFSATHFSAVFTPDNRTATLRIEGETLITGRVLADVNLIIYGYETDKQTINPCKIKAMDGLCPMRAGPLELTMTNIPISKDTLGMIPSVAYTVPDIDAIVRIEVKHNQTREIITIVEASLSNGQTTYQAGVGWTVAVIAGIGLALAVIVPSIWGYSDDAVRLAGYIFSLFGFIQGQAMVGMLAVPLPPIVQSWTQNFQWSMGVVHAEILETMCTWYLRSTGGTADELLSVLSTSMVNVLRKRDSVAASPPESSSLAKRASSTTTSNVVVRGLKRVAFRAHIEETNLFLTTILLFTFVTLLLAIFIALWKAAQLHPRMQTTQTQSKSISKGLLYRVYFLAFTPICIFSLWELTNRDSPAEIIVAIVSFLSILSTIAWAVAQVLIMRRRALAMHRSPISTLFSEDAILHKYGFLYLHFNAHASYFAAIILASVFVKALFVGLAQSSPTSQAIAFLIIDLAMLIAVSIIRPWIDKKSNAVNITISTIGFLHALFVLFFSAIFDQPKMVSSVMGVILFVSSAALILVLISFIVFYAVKTILAARGSGGGKPYRPMSEMSESGAPMRSSARLTGEHTELDELSATSRGIIKRESVREAI
ncbi:hypothetical protein BJX64DRAFT_256857 [Aspergillus heterothallicus]